MSKAGTKKGYAFGTFQGVFTPAILTIIGVILYLRFGWMLGHVGLVKSLVLITIGSTITFLTALSISALATNMRMKGGGAYFMISRSLGAEAGAATGIPLVLAQAIGVSFYIAGFAEALVSSGLPYVGAWDPRLVGFVPLVILAGLAAINADIALKSQYLIMAAIVFSLVSFFLGGTPDPLPVADPEKARETLDVWTVFAVIFPAVTGVLSGVGLSGDLKNPRRSIPLGTIAAVLTGYAVYMAVPIVLNRFVTDPAVLKSDTMILMKCARWTLPILLGVWAASLSSAVGNFLCAPRVVQALARDRILPRVLGKGVGKTDDPRAAAALCFLISAVGLWFGDINVIAPVLTMFYLSTYTLLNFSAACEAAMHNPSWRPTFRVKAVFSFTGFLLCIAAMFMISPGWTFIAIACEVFIYWLVKRRALNARWGDMRTGLYVAFARFAMNHLETHGRTLRNWRPDVLAFTELTSKSSDVIDLAHAISAGRGMVTLASIVPAQAGTPEREENLARILRDKARRAGFRVLTRVHAAADTWTGIRDLVRAYGFGPFVPDTIILGVPVKDDLTPTICSLTEFIAARRRNTILVRDRTVPDAVQGRIDVWWRGQNQNGPFMLALARLIQQSRGGGLSIRLCQIAPEGASPEDAKLKLQRYLAEARVEADVHVLPANPALRAIVQIAVASADSAFTFIGLRVRAADESEAAYAEDFRATRDILSPLPCAVFALAAEGVDFKKIYRE